MNAMTLLGRWTLDNVRRWGRETIFLLHTLAGVPSLMRRFYLVISQVFAVGVLTLVIILVSGLFVGMVLGLQGYNTLVDFGAESSLGLLVALSLTRD